MPEGQGFDSEPRQAARSRSYAETVTTLAARVSPTVEAVVRASLVGPEDSKRVVAVLGGISASHHVADMLHHKGWWSRFAGPGRAVDTREVRLLGFRYAAPVGAIPTTADQARFLVEVLDALGIPRLSIVVGASYGGMVALALARDWPNRVGRLVVICAAHRSDPMATAWRCIQRRIVRLGIRGGYAHESIVLARALAMTTYRSRDEFAQRFTTKQEIGPDGTLFPVERYLLSCGERFAGEVDAERFLCLSESLDLHDVEPERMVVPAHFVTTLSDQLVPAGLVHELSARYAGRNVVTEISSIYGHDAFLKEVDQLSAILITECRSDTYG